MRKMFSQRHYEVLARFLEYEISISDLNTTDRATVIKGIARLLANLLGNDNPKFNRTRFLAACGIED
jgi:hypothetical protein